MGQDNGIPSAGGGVVVLLGIAAVSMCRDGNTSGGIVCMVIAALLGIGFLIGGICGHKRKWEQ